MKKIILLSAIVALIFATNQIRGQVTNGSLSPDWTLTDINGVSHNLFSYLNAGKTVFIDISATWCGPCFAYHQSGAFEDLWVNHGPAGGSGVSSSTTNDCMVFFIEGDATTTNADLNGTGSMTQGDWISGTHHPIIDPTASTNPTTDVLLAMYNLTYFPTCVMICPDHTMTEVDQYTASQLYAAKQACSSIISPNTGDAGVLGVNSPSGSNCDGTISPLVEIKNYGLQVLSSCIINYQIDNNTVQTQNWSGSLLNGQSINVSLPTVTVPSGSHTLTCFTSNPNGTIDADGTNDQSVSPFTISSVITPTVSPASSCSSASITLGATGSGTLNWYSVPSGGTSIGTGNNFATPVLTATTTYYVESENPGVTGNVGPANTTVFGGGGYHNNTSVQYLTFDVFQSCTLQTALVNSGAAGTRNIILWDNSGNQIASYPIAFPNGTGVMNLNIPLTPGSYRIGGSDMNLWRNNTGGTYPYNLNGIINITGSSAGASFYYYLYNWQIETTPCVSPRIPVVATIGAPVVTYAATPKDSVCTNSSAITLTGGSPAGGSYSGVGVSAGSFDPSIAGVGNHTITYLYNNGSGCTNTATHDIYVKACTLTGIGSLEEISKMVLYPNPTSGNFALEIGVLHNQEATIEVMNSFGQTVYTENHTFVSGNNKLELNLSSVAQGVYFVKVKTLSNVLIKSIVIK
jgi:thiol-disulfide isomerase/thioredoxin